MIATYGRVWKKKKVILLLRVLYKRNRSITCILVRYEILLVPHPILIHYIIPSVIDLGDITLFPSHLAFY